MNDFNYGIYKNMMSAKPILDKNYFTNILGEKIDDYEVTEIIESNTSLIIKINITVKYKIKKLFIKTIKTNRSENTYHEMSMKEGLFYKLLKNAKADNLPMPECYDIFVSKEKEEFLIVLEDVSDRFYLPDKTTLQDKKVWFSCADSLAKFHSKFWNYGTISQDKDNKEHDAQGDRECLTSFLNDFKDKFDNRIRKTLEHAMEINISLINETTQRLNNKSNVTICNGDSHIYNFMLPVEQDGNPLIVDFQFWGEGIGTGDLAHLTRVGFSDDLKRNIQLPLIENYYNSLLKYGVKDYSWETCLNDYRKSVASMVLIPLWQYAIFGLKYDEWIGDLQGLIFNYEYLNCDELYSNNELSGLK